MLSLPTSCDVRLRKRALPAALLATSALVLLVRAGLPGHVSTGAFLAALTPTHGTPEAHAAARAETTMQEKRFMELKTEANDANMKKAAEMKAEFMARQDNQHVEEEEKRGFFSRLRPGKKPSILDIFADPGLANDDRFPKTAAMEAAQKQKNDFDQRNPPPVLPAVASNSIWPISGEIPMAAAPGLPAAVKQAAPAPAAEEPAAAEEETEAEK